MKIEIPKSIQETVEPKTILEFATETFSPIAFASSFSLEDLVIIDMLVKSNSSTKIFALDTGRLYPETYECAHEVQLKYGIKIEWYFPDQKAVENLERDKGLFSFKENIDARKACCNIRKVQQLSRALEGQNAWITGLRREQSATRQELHPFEFDHANGGIHKINPLHAWTLDQVWEYVKSYRLPYNRLYDRGFLSIGCAPCTRAVKSGESERAGRWWWEDPSTKECGIHMREAFKNSSADLKQYFKK